MNAAQNLPGIRQKGRRSFPGKRGRKEFVITVALQFADVSFNEHKKELGSNKFKYRVPLPEFLLHIRRMDQWKKTLINFCLTKHTFARGILVLFV